MPPLWIRNGHYSPVVEPRRQTWTKRVIVSGLVVAVVLIVSALKAPEPWASVILLRFAQLAAIVAGLAVCYFVALLSSEQR